MQQKTVRAAVEGGRQPASLKFLLKMNNFDNFSGGGAKEPFIVECAGHFKPFFSPLLFFSFRMRLPASVWFVFGLLSLSYCLP